MSRLHPYSTPLPSLLPFLLKPQLYHIPIKSANAHLYLIPSLQHENLDRKFISSTKLMICLILPIYIILDTSVSL